MRLYDESSRATDLLATLNDPEVRLSYSQFGEDRLLEVLFHGRTSGFYVDIGAHHPRRISNTFLLHKAGWRGVNVDLSPALIAEFERERPGDINIVAALAESERDVTVRLFDEPAVNTVSDDKAAEYAAQWTVLSSQTVRTTTLARLLDSHLPAGQAVDLLTVDVEGLDLAVLRGNDWDRYRPQVLLVELDGLDLHNVDQHATVAYLKSVGYRLHAYMHISAFFTRV